MTDTNVERAARIDTATLSDALDKLVIAGQCLGIKPLNQSFRLSGRAFTLGYAPAGPGGAVGDFIDDVPEGAVIVIDNGGRPDATVWEILANPRTSRHVRISHGFRPCRSLSFDSRPQNCRQAMVAADSRRYSIIHLMNFEMAVMGVRGATGAQVPASASGARATTPRA